MEFDPIFPMAAFWEHLFSQPLPITLRAAELLSKMIPPPDQCNTKGWAAGPTKVPKRQALPGWEGGSNLWLSTLWMSDLMPVF